MRSILRENNQVRGNGERIKQNIKKFKKLTWGSIYK
jgi:hypothetical protein